MLAREGMLAPGLQSVWRWGNGQTATCKTDKDAIEIVYRYEYSDGKREVEARLWITWTPCHLGGQRAWFSCPHCGRRVAIVYLWGRPKCRTCARMTYPSQSEDAIARSWRRTQKIEKVLAGGKGEWDYKKPKGMRWPTFERLTEAYWREEELRDTALFAFMERHQMHL